MKKLSKREMYLLGNAKAQLDAAVAQLREAVMNLNALGRPALGNASHDLLKELIVVSHVVTDVAKKQLDP